MKKILFMLTMITIIAVSVYSLVFMYSNNENTDVRIDLELINEIRQGSLDIYEVKVGNISNSITIEAVIDGDEECYMEYSEHIEEKDQYNIMISAGMKFKAGDELYSLNDKRINADKDGQCLGVNVQKDALSINVIYYENIAVKAYIPPTFFNKDINMMDIVARFGGEEYEMELHEILTETEDGNVATLFKPKENDICLFPGSRGEIEVCVEKKENVLLVPLAYIEYKGENGFEVCIIDGEEINYVPVYVGIIDDESAEITGGLIENAKVVRAGGTVSLEYYINMNGWDYID